MIDEYVVVPDVFDAASYANATAIDMCMDILKEPLLMEGALVADLGSGGWSRFCAQPSQQLHRRCREIVRKLALKNRLRPHPLAGNTMPVTADDWCREGLAAMRGESFTGIIAGDATKKAFDAPQIASIEKLTSADWYRQRTRSVTIDRKTNQYLQVLDKLLKHARSLMFIDPYLDPSASNYREFYKLLLPLVGRDCQPKIELHRTCFDGAGRDRYFPSQDEWAGRFSKLKEGLGGTGLKIEIYLWENFHDRHLITDLVGILIGAGFDITGQANDPSTWARLDELDKEGIQRRFDPASGALKQSFTLQM
jgi:hypothetical protein